MRGLACESTPRGINCAKESDRMGARNERRERARASLKQVTPTRGIMKYVGGPFLDSLFSIILCKHAWLCL